MNILIEEPTEYSPVELIRLAQQALPTLRYRHFAIAFKYEPNTIGRWMCGVKNFSKLHRVWAAVGRSAWRTQS